MFDDGSIMKVIHKLVYSLLATIPVVALVSCSSGGGGGGAASAQPPEQRTIVVDEVPTADEAGLYIALDNGFFAQQGLTVKLNPVFGGELGLPDLQTGKAQLLVGNYVSFILAQIAGKFGAPGKPAAPISLRIIADGSQMQTGNQALYVLPGSRFKTVADLTRYHAKVGINTKNNIGQVLLGSLFQENGLDLHQIHQVAEPFPLLVGDLASGKLDVAWLPEPFGTQAQQQFGAVKLADFNQGSLQNFPIGAYIGTTQWVQSHPSTVAAFLRALQEGQQIADTNRAAVESAVEKDTKPDPTPKIIASTMTLDSYPLVMDIPEMQRVADAMYQFGVIGRPYKIINMIQPEPGMIR